MEDKIKTLKEKGLSYRKIASELNISLGRVQRSLNKIRIDTLSVSIQKDTPEQGDAVLKAVKEITLNFEKRLKEHELRVNNIAEELNEKTIAQMEKTLHYAMLNGLDHTIEIKLKEVLSQKKTCLAQ